MMLFLLLSRVYFYSSSSGLLYSWYLQGRQAVVIGQLLGLFITQVLDAQAQSKLLQRHRRHVVGHVINLRVQGESWERLRTSIKVTLFSSSF